MCHKTETYFTYTISERNRLWLFSFQFCSLGRLSHDVGWKYQDVIETLEAKRKVKAEDFHNRNVTKAKAVADAEKAVAAQTKPITEQIAAFGVA